MPELPEVAYLESYVKRTSLNQVISSLDCREPALLANISCKQLAQELVGAQLRDASRRGKFLIIETDASGKKLVLYFGETGSLSYGKVEKRDKQSEQYASLIIYFKKGEYELRITSKRKLGKLYWTKDLEGIEIIKSMGPEPLVISRAEFFKLLDNKKRKQVRSFLMDQKDLAGLGSEYSEKILAAAGVEAKRKIGQLSGAERQQLYEQMRQVLEEAIASAPKRMRGA